MPIQLNRNTTPGLSPIRRRARKGLGPAAVLALALPGAVLAPDALRAAGTVPAVAEAQAPEFVITAVRIFDGMKTLERGEVWVRNGKIEAVGGRVKAPAGVRRVDGTGQTLLPGLFDAHTHVWGNALRDALVSGVTTELDMFMSHEMARDIRADQAAGRGDDIADLRSAGTLVTAPNGHGTEYGLAIPTITAPSEAQAFVDARIAEGSDYIKIVYDDGKTYHVDFPALSLETMSAVIAAAHARGKLAVVHIGTLAGARDAIEAGCDGLVHLFVDEAPDADFAALAARHHVFVVPTLSVLASVAGEAAGAQVAGDARLDPYLTPEALASLRAVFPHPAGGYANAEAAVRALRARGVPLLAGTDAPNPGTTHGASLHGELALLVRAGLTPTEALAAATSAPAAAFHLADRGRIAPGLRADLLLVRGDPTTDIMATRDIATVWKRGVEVDRAKDAQAVAEARAAAVAQKTAPPPAGSTSGWISDFENGTAAAQFGAGWTVSTDSFRGGQSTAAMQVVAGGADGSAKALHVNGEIVAGPVTWAGAMFFPGDAPMAPVNLSHAKSLSFWAKGDGGTYQVMVYAKSNGWIPKMKTFTAGSGWNKFEFPFAAFDTDGHDIMGMLFGAAQKPGAFQFAIDNVRLD